MSFNRQPIISRNLWLLVTLLAASPIFVSAQQYDQCKLDKEYLVIRDIYGVPLCGKMGDWKRDAICTQEASVCDTLYTVGAQNSRVEGISHVRCAALCAHRLHICKEYAYDTSSSTCFMFDFKDGNYVRDPTCSSFRRIEDLPMSHPVNEGDCLVEIQSWGNGDSPATNDGFVRMNGNPHMSTSGAANTGMHIFIPKYADCNSYLADSSYKWPSTNSDYSAMFEFIDNLPTDIIFMIITAYKPNENSVMEPYIRNIHHLGGPRLDPASLPEDAKLAMFVQKGRPWKTVWAYSGPGQPSVNVKIQMWGPSLTDVKFYKIN